MPARPVRYELAAMVALTLVWVFLTAAVLS